MKSQAVPRATTLSGTGLPLDKEALPASIDGRVKVLGDPSLGRMSRARLSVAWSSVRHMKTQAAPEGAVTVRSLLATRPRPPASTHQGILEGGHVAAMLYGSQARGNPRADSDVDLLQLVDSSPRSYSKGQVNVTAYTVDHLAELAVRGSLFVRHLLDEGEVLYDDAGVLQGILCAYREPKSYDHLKRELAIVLRALRSEGAERYPASARRVAIYAVRTALYVITAEAGQPIFDVERAAMSCGLPFLAFLLRNPQDFEVVAMCRFGDRLVGRARDLDMPRDFDSIALWSRDEHSMSSRLLEAVVANDTRLDYTTLTLPIA